MDLVELHNPFLSSYIHSLKHYYWMTLSLLLFLLALYFSVCFDSGPTPISDVTAQQVFCLWPVLENICHDITVWVYPEVKLFAFQLLGAKYDSENTFGCVAAMIVFWLSLMRCFTLLLYCFTKLFYVTVHLTTSWLCGKSVFSEATEAWPVWL